MSILTKNMPKSGNDEYYTPKRAVVPLLKYIEQNSTIWCPFDTDDSYYVKVFKEHGFNVINTHINNGEDFFSIEVPECDYIISNPPYTLKNNIIARLYEIGKPFAMLVSVVGLFDGKKKIEMYKDKDVEVMYMSPRISFFKDYDTQEEIKGMPYQSVYICSKLLPKQIVFEEIGK